ncbi:uncharacterized protein LOC114522118 [Dendronephthya gigantea]|uniref:uncharacterized protein LOC114522118 n=1 Tax=Dendronephthya gigantea TaxID=151771 RepID=UPI00106C050A|nr:uncharacterized protein LOC114522118 [Dendronephthya gigantea]
MQENTLSEIKDAAQQIKSSSSFGEVPSINLTDEYSNEKFTQDLLQFIEHGNNLENWHHGSYHGSYQDTATDSFSHHMQIESVPIGPIQDCIDADIKPRGESSLTLTVLNSTGTDESSHPMSFTFGETSTHETNLIDHDYCAYPKTEYSGMESYHGGVNNNMILQSEQGELGMDQEKLLRMKRRKEKNRECSRQFRLKQKSKEENLKTGRVEKIRKLEELRRSVDNLKTTLGKVAAQCCSKCPKTRMLLSQHSSVNKENITPNYMKIVN